MTNPDPALPNASAPRATKALPDIVEARNAPVAKASLSRPFSPMVRRLAASWTAHKNTQQLAKAGDGALCVIGLTMLAAALLAYFGIV